MDKFSSFVKNLLHLFRVQTVQFFLIFQAQKEFADVHLLPVRPYLIF